MNNLTVRISDIHRHEMWGTRVELSAWVRSVRDNGSITFIDVNDGSALQNLQVVLPSEMFPPQGTTGVAIHVSGILVTSPASGQQVELKAEGIEILGTCDQTDYPLQKKRHGFDFLRSIPHLRARSNTFAAMARMRSFLSHAIHNFFSDEDYLYVHTPIITSNDAEGAGELFHVHHDKGSSFFGRPCYLTVSGQLAAETYATALGRVYSFGPTFRAENSNTNRHLSEFWMVEAEAAFLDLEALMSFSERLLKQVVSATIEQRMEELIFFDTWIAKGLLKKLEDFLTKPFERLSYQEALHILKKAHKNFTVDPHWGMDLQTEHERFLSEIHCKAPVLVFNYPKDNKAFYMRINEDGKTVAAMDLLVPHFGEIIGGSQREERYEYLVMRMKEFNMDLAPYSWYLDLRRFGSVIHSGFGLGFERLIQFITGMHNIRDVIPFPRAPGLVQG